MGLGANVLVAVEALVGLLGFSLATGLTFARFSLPSAKVRFSRRATIAPYRGGRALMFRIVNERTSQLVEVGATVTLAWRPRDGATSTRRFLPLPLERNSVVFFPMHWVVVHPIDEASPLAGVDAEGLREMDAELLILVTGTDEASSQTVQVRSSYKADEIVVGGRFADLFLPARSDGRIGVDLARFDELEPAELPPADRVPMKEV